jgi:hypothetical protein
MPIVQMEIILRKPHEHQREFIESPAKRKIVRAGRRSGKTVGSSVYAVWRFLDKRRILYASPTLDQVERFWYEVNTMLSPLVDTGYLYKNETKHLIEVAGTENRIRAKTAWNADTLRGDYADEVIFDEWQLMNEDAWDRVGAPMLMDNNGNAIFIYTPPSLHSRSVSKADDPQHAAKMFKRAQQDDTGRWAAFHFTSYDNPYISREAIDATAHDMTALARRMEILAEDIDEAPGALWTRAIIEKYRELKAPEELEYIVVGVDPTATSTGDEAGIITAGRKGEHFYPMADDSTQGSPLIWAKAVVAAYYRFSANMVIAESNQGGEMVALTIATVDPNVPVQLVHASRGKQTRAEPISALYEKGFVHHVGEFAALEDEMCLWIPGDPSPNRMDALVWAMTGLSSGTASVAWI